MIKKLLLLFVALSFVYACNKEETEEPIDLTDQGLVIFKNQTGDPNADALQAQYKVSQGTLNIYGTFDINSNPRTIKTLTYERAENDTIVNFVINPLTTKVTTAFISVNGVKSEEVFRFNYSNNEVMNFSVHKYDWNTETSEIILSVNLDTSSKTFSNKMITNNKLNIEGKDGLWALGGLLAGLAIVDAALTYVGSAAALGLFATVGAAASTLVAMAGIMAIAASFYPSDGNASELFLTDYPYPQDTRVMNPVSEDEDPTPNLLNPCENSNLSVVLGVDPGNVFTAIVNGNSSEYEFHWSTGDTYTAAISNTITAPSSGEYSVLVVDENGCTAFATVNSDDASGVSKLQGLWEFSFYFDQGCNSGSVLSQDNVDNYWVEINQDMSFTKYKTISRDVIEYTGSYTYLDENKYLEKYNYYGEEEVDTVYIFFPDEYSMYMTYESSCNPEPYPEPYIQYSVFWRK